MDPRAALISILSGHEMQDHLEALHEWLRNGGFQPAPVYLPCDCAPCFADLPRETDITVNGYGLIVANGRTDSEGQHYYDVKFTWSELARFADPSLNELD